MENCMKRGVAVSIGTLALLALLGCSGTPPRAPSSAAPSLTVSYVDSAPPVIEINAVNALALSTAELVARDGRVLRRATIERETLPGVAPPSPTVGVGVFGGSHGVEGGGIGIGLPLGGISQPPPPGPVRAKARVPIDDVEAYRRDWPDLIVRLRFGSAPGPISVADLPAPAPRGR